MSAGMGGFEELLDGAEFSFGQLEAAEAGAAGFSLDLETATGITTVDAVAIDEFAGEVALLGFVWRSLDAQAARDRATAEGVVLSDTEKEQIDAGAETETCVLTVIVPWRDVIEVRMGDEVLGLFGGDSP